MDWRHKNTIFFQICLLFSSVLATTTAPVWNGPCWLSADGEHGLRRSWVDEERRNFSGLRANMMQQLFPHILGLDILSPIEPHLKNGAHTLRLGVGQVHIVTDAHEWSSIPILTIQADSQKQVLCKSSYEKPWEANMFWLKGISFDIWILLFLRLQ